MKDTKKLPKTKENREFDVSTNPSKKLIDRYKRELAEQRREHEKNERDYASDNVSHEFEKSGRTTADLGANGVKEAKEIVSNRPKSRGYTVKDIKSRDPAHSLTKHPKTRMDQPTSRQYNVKQEQMIQQHFDKTARNPLFRSESPKSYTNHKNTPFPESSKHRFLKDTDHGSGRQLFKERRLKQIQGEAKAFKTIASKKDAQIVKSERFFNGRDQMIKPKSKEHHQLITRPVQMVQRHVMKHTQKKMQQQAAKTATKNTAKASERLLMAARQATIVIAKAAVLITKGIIAVLSVAWPIVIAIIFIGVIAALIASPFGLFFSGDIDDPDTTPVSVVIQQTEAEYNSTIDSIINDVAHDTLRIHYYGTGGSRGNIWMDILAVFAVHTTMSNDSIDVITIDATRVDLIRSTFWDMTDIDYYVQTVTHTEYDGDGDSYTWYEYILHITIVQRDAYEQAEIYDFDSDQMQMIDDLLSGEFDSYFWNLIAGLGQVGDGTGVIAKGIYIWPSPTSDYVTSFYGTRVHPITGKVHTHQGIDIGAAQGMPVLAAADGTVSRVAYDAGGYGHYVILDHADGHRTLYAHMSQSLTTQGATVSQGDTIGLVGSTGDSTGPHIHFETYIDGTRVDPLLYFDNYTSAW